MEFLLSSVRKWFDPWPQRWTKIFSTWNTRSKRRTQTNSNWNDNSNCTSSLERQKYCSHLQFDMTGLYLQPLQEVFQQTLTTTWRLMGDFYSGIIIKDVTHHIVIALCMSEIPGYNTLQRPAGVGSLQKQPKDTSNFLEKVARTGIFIICRSLHQGGHLQ